MTRVLRMRPKLEVVTIDNRPLRDISDMVENGKVVMNSKNATAWTFQGSIREPVELRPFHDFLAPSLDVIYANGTVLSSQVGLYAIVPPPKRHERAGTTQLIEGRDLTWLLDVDAFEDTYSIDVTDDALQKVTEICVSAGIPASRIRFGAKSTPAGHAEAAPVAPSARDWPISTSMTKRIIANDILHMIGYEPLGMDSTGWVGSDPYRDTRTATADVTYASGAGSQVTGELSEAGLPLEEFANIVVIYAGSPATADAVVPPDTVNPTIANGRTVRVTAEIGLRLRDAGNLISPILLVMPKGTPAKVTGTSVASGGYTWWPITAEVAGVGSRSGWAAGTWLATVAGDPDPVTDPDKLRPPIYAYRENDDPASPVSTVSLRQNGEGGRWVRMESPSGIETQAQADEEADRLIAEALGYSRELTLRTLPDPRRKMHEVYGLDIIRDRAGIVVADGKWRCTGWELGFEPERGVMTHTCYKIEDWAGQGAMG